MHWVEFDPVKGSEQGGLRPALVVQHDVGNAHSPTTVVAAITRPLPPRPYPFVVVVSPADSGLPDVSAVNCSQLATIQQTGPESRLRSLKGTLELRPVGRLSPARMAGVDAALRYSLGMS